MTVTLRDAQGSQLPAPGRPIAVRPAEADDIGPLTGFLMRLSAHTCHQRYLAARSFSLALARDEAARIAAARTRHHLAFVAEAPLFGVDEVVGVAELARLAGEPAVGELAVVVRDDLQGAGVGSRLALAVAEAAPRLGIHTLHIEQLADNSAMRRLAARLGDAAVIGRADGVLQLRVRLGAQAAASRPQPAAWWGHRGPRRAA